MDKRYYTLSIIAVITALAVILLPSWNWIPNGILVAAISLGGGLFLRKRYAKTMDTYFSEKDEDGKSNFQKDWDKCSPNVRVAVYVAVCMSLFIGLVLCFN